MMTYEECLQWQSEDTIAKIEAEHGGRKASELLDASYLAELYEQMEWDEREVLQFFLFVKGYDILTNREIEAGSDRLSVSRFRIGLAKLRRKGYVFTLRKAWGELAYMMPKEVFRSFFYLLIERELNPRSLRSPCARITHERQPLIIWDLLSWMRYIRDHEVEVTKKQTIRKNILKRMREHLSLKGEHLSVFRGYKHEQTYEPHEAFCLHLLQRMGCLLLDGNRLLLNSERAEAWVSKTQAELADAVREWFTDDAAALSDAARRIVDALLFFKSDREAEGWINLRRLAKTFQEWNGLQVTESVLQELLDRYCLPLWAMGYMELGRDAEGFWLCQWTTYEESGDAGTVYLQPTLECLFPSTLPLSYHWRFSAIAEIVKKDRMLIYRITKEKIHKRLQEGWRESDLLSYATGDMRVQIHPAVEEQVARWAEQKQRISFSDVRLMRCADAQTARELEALTELAPYIVEKIGERDFIISREIWAELLETLQKYGYSYSDRVEQESGNEMKEDRDHMESAGDLFSLFPQKNSAGFKVENVFPEKEDVIPGVRRLPRLWTQNFQGYHLSTVRQMTERASRMKLSLKILDNENREQTVEPRRLVNRQGTWTLITSRRDIPLENIRKIQILVPEISTKKR